MIKAEVVFDGDIIKIGDDFIIELDYPQFDLYRSGEWVESFDFLEQAIAYCLEQSK